MSCPHYDKVNNKCGLTTQSEWNNLNQGNIMNVMLYNNLCSDNAEMHYTDCGVYKNMKEEGRVQYIQFVRLRLCSYPLAVAVKLTEKISGKKGIKSIKIPEEKIVGDTATVQFIINYGDGSTEQDDEKPIKQDGKWKLTAPK